MVTQSAPLLEEWIEIAAPPERVWDLLADLSAMSRWSPSVQRVEVLGPLPAAVGTRTRNTNRAGLLTWTTRSEVVRLEPEQELAFRIRDNRAIWSFTLEPCPGGTRVRHRRETPDGVSTRARRLERTFWGSIGRFESRLRAGMRHTLAGLKAEAEAADLPHGSRDAR